MTNKVYLLLIIGLMSIIIIGCENTTLDPKDNNIIEIKQNTKIIEGNQKETIMEGTYDSLVQLDFSNPEDQIIINNARKAEIKINSDTRSQNGSWWYDGAKIGDVIKLDVDGNKLIDTVQLQNGYVIVTRSVSSGAFQILFRPWAGYCINCGWWLKGDYNGDGREDLAHLVAGTDYINIWLSNGDGTFSIMSFRPWSGYAITAGTWLAADFNGDGKCDLIHLVASDYVHTWFSLGNGSFNVTSFRPWSGYAISSGYWVLANLNNDNKVDLVHYCCPTYIHTWISDGKGSYLIGSAPR